jgi:hypothetical protein
MFKNTTRNGLAIGAAIALVVSGLATVPAQAAGEVVLAPSAGTSYSTFVTEDFTLQASLGAGQPSGNAVQLKYQIEKAAGVTVSYGVSTSSAVETSLATVSSTVLSTVVSAAGAGATTQNFLKLAINGATSVSATANVTVTAFVDANNNSVLDSGEFSAVQVVSFKKYSEVTSTITITQPVERDVAVVGTVVLDGINRSQVQSAVGVVTSRNGAAIASVSATSTFSTTVTALVSGSTVSAQAVVANFNVGAASATLTATGSTVFAITASAVVGPNALSAAGAGTVRVNSAFAVQGTALNGTTTTASGVAGAAVTVLVTTNATFTATSSVTLNGTVYTTSASLPTALAVTTDASGNAVVNVSTTNFAANNTLTFTFKSQTLTATAFVATQTADIFTATADGSGFQTLAPSAGFSVNYSVVDQWKVAPAAGYRLEVLHNAVTKYAVISAGVASATFTATNSAAVQNVTLVSMEKQDSVTSNWGDVSTAVHSAVVSIKTTTVAASFTTAPTHSATAVVSRASASPKSGYLNALSITGKANHAGQAVTVTAAGVDFSEVATTVAATKNSFTTNADGNGFWTVSAFVHVSGKTTFNYSAGAATASTVVDVAAPFGNEGTTLNIVVVTGDYAAPGSTLRAKVTLADEFGNPVAANDAATESFVISISGPGFMSALPTRFLATGETSEFSILLGNADAGTVTLTATYDADGTGTAKAAVTVTKAVTVGVAPVVETQKVNVGSFKGFVALYAKGYEGQRMSAIVAGKWIQVASLKSGFERVVRFTGAGYDITVKIYIDGKQVGSDFMVTTK